MVLYLKQSPRTPSLGNFKYKQIQCSQCPYRVEWMIRFKQTLVFWICREIGTGTWSKLINYKMLWYNSGWEILQKHDTLLFSILMPFQVFLCLLRYPKSMLIIAQMWEIFFAKLYWHYQLRLFIHPNGCQLQRDLCFYYSPMPESNWWLRGERSHIRLLILWARQSFRPSTL